MKVQDPTMQRLKMKKILDYKQDKQLSMAGVSSKFTALKRKDSAPPQVHRDFTNCLEVNKLPLVITPGINTVRLKKRADSIGRYFIGQMAVHIKNLHLVSLPVYPRLLVEVKEEGPTLKLYKNAAPLLSGIEQIMNLILTIGSYSIEPKSLIKLTTSPGLTVQVERGLPLVTSLEIEVGQNFPFTSSRRHLRIMADMLSKDHQVTIHCPWTTKPIVVNLTFSPPLAATWKLQTVELRKFVQVAVVGQCERDLIVEDAGLIIAGETCDIVAKNCESSQIIPNGLSYFYMWEILFKEELGAEPPTLKVEFSVKYKLDDKDDDNKLYRYFFDINDYQTLYILDTNVTPMKGTEFCRAGAVCQLHLTICPAAEHLPITQSVMYEVLAENGVWAVCGRTAGVVTFGDGAEEKAGEVTLDVMPLCGATCRHRWSGCPDTFTESQPPLVGLTCNGLLLEPAHLFIIYKTHFSACFLIIA
nr:unnamed protein product [Callosobruchus chinensis]